MSGFDERDLSRELHERSEQVGGHPIGLDQVKGRARRIRRRRRVAGAVAAVAVAAVAVPVGLNLTTASTTGTGPVGRPTPTAASASPTPTPSESPSESPSPAPSPTEPGPATEVPLTAQGAATGAAPQVDYLQGATLHGGDGSVRQLPAAYTDLTSFHGGWLAARFAQGETSVVELDGSNTVVSTTPGSDRFAISQDGTQVSWFTTPGAGKAGTLWTADVSGMGDGRGSTTIPAGTQVTPVGWGRAGVVYEAYRNEPQVWNADGAGHTRRLPGLVAATGTLQEDDLVAGQTSATDTGSCWTVMKIATGQHLWNTCDFALGRFSTDGRYVLGTDAYADGAGGRTVAVLDAHSGKVLTRYRIPDTAQAFTGDSVWEHDGSLLTILNEDGAWHMLRLSTDGRVERALGPVPGSADNGAPWRFAALP